MNARSFLTVAALLAASTLAACGGAGGAASGTITPPTGGGAGQSVQSQTEDSIDTANALGSPVSDISSENDSLSSPLQPAGRIVQDARTIEAIGDGSCKNGVEFFAPDKKGDANSTERIVFYDNGCTQMQSDAVRIYTSTGANSETIQRTVSRYKLNASTPSSVRSETIAYTNATFDAFGYPLYKNGFDRTHTGELDVNGVKTIDGDGEAVVGPLSGNVTNYCGDSAGFNATGNASLNETFGWSGTIANGTRTVNSDGSVTWNFTRAGNSYTGPIGGLSIEAGTQNSSCPVTAPMFTLGGGTLKGSSSLPITASFSNGVLSSLAVSNGTLANGDTLNVSTNSGVSPGDEHFISGTLAKSGTTIASFNVNAFGDGTLVVTASGTAYDIEDWHVVK